MKKIAFAWLLLILYSCGITGKPHTGTQVYMVTAAKKQGASTRVKLQGLHGWHLLHSDTLKIGDKITVSWIEKN